MVLGVDLDLYGGGGGQDCLHYYAYVDAVTGICANAYVVGERTCGNHHLSTERKCSGGLRQGEHARRRQGDKVGGKVGVAGGYRNAYQGVDGHERASENFLGGDNVDAIAGLNVIFHFIEFLDES